MIVETLKEEILSGKYSSTRLFPSERAIATRFKVSRPTVRQAMQALREAGFILRRQGSGTFVTRIGAFRKIGLISYGAASGEFAGMMVQTISNFARKSGYALLYADFSADKPRDAAREARLFAEKLSRESVLGVIFMPMTFCSDARAYNRAILEPLKSANVPVVLCDIGLDASSDEYDVIGINNIKAGRRIADHLLDVGAKRIVFWLRPCSALSHLDRAYGVQIAINSREGECSYRQVLARPEDCSALSKCLRKDRPDAIVCGNDEIAVLVRSSLAKIRVRVPDDIMLAGFDDINMASMLTPSLTTVHQPCAQIGERVFTRLLSRIKNPALPTEEIFLPAPLVVRDSTSVKTRSRNVDRKPCGSAMGKR